MMLFILGICLLLSAFGYMMLIWRLWLVDGTMDAAVAVLLGGGAMLLLGMGIRTESIPLLWGMVVLMGGGSILFVALDDHYEKTSARRRVLDDIRKLKQKLQFNNGDWRAWRDLGTACMKLELYEEAVSAYKNAIRLDPPDVMMLRKSLNDALDLGKMGKMSEVNICPNCKLETPRKSKVCVHCGAPMRFDLGRFISTPNMYGNSIRYVVLLLAGIATLVLLLSPFPLEVKAVIAMTVVVVCALLIWRSLENA